MFRIVKSFSFTVRPPYLWRSRTTGPDRVYLPLSCVLGSACFCDSPGPGLN
jgi:hypothetical protein